VTRTASITEAKAQLSRLIEEVEQGGEIIIQRGGRSVAVLSAYQRDKTPRQLGAWEGRVWIADDFDDLPDDIAEAFGA
jgi:prevent-host-death family protein